MKSLGKSLHHIERRVPQSTFDLADVGYRKSHVICQGLLGESTFEPNTPHV